MIEELRRVKEKYEAYKFAKKAAKAQFPEWLAEQVAVERDEFYAAVKKADSVRDDFGKRLVTRQEIHEIGMSTKATKELYAVLKDLNLIGGTNG